MSYITSRPTLRAYQREGVQKVLENLRAGRHTVLVAPTGSGKTVMAAEIAKEFNCVLFVAHRRELIQQARAATDGGTVYADTVQSLQGGSPKSVDLLVIDEAHRAAAASYRRLIARCPNAVRLGLTATPLRNDGRGLADAFNEIVEVASVKSLITKGHLVQFRALEAPDEALDKLASLRRRHGDYDQSQLAEVMNRPRLVSDVVREYRKHAEGRRGLVFAVSVEHSRALSEAFNAAGVRAVHLDGHTADHRRRAALSDVASGRIDVICNVNLFTEGWDCPPISCVTMARPTESLSLYLQSVGRGLRPWDGKMDLLVLDHAGNIARLGSPDEQHTWSLESASQRIDRERRELEVARLRALGFASLEEYELGQSRVRSESYPSALVMRMLRTKSLYRFMASRGIKPVGGGSSATRYPKAPIDAFMDETGGLLTLSECERLLAPFTPKGRLSGFICRHGVKQPLKKRYARRDIEALVETLNAKFSGTYTAAHISERRGVSLSSVSLMMRRHGIKPFSFGRYSAEAVDALFSEMDSGYDVETVARLLQIHKSGVRIALRRRGIVPAIHNVYPRREIDALVNERRKAEDLYYTRRQAAELLGVSYQNAGRALAGVRKLPGGLYNKSEVDALCAGAMAD